VTSRLARGGVAAALVAAALLTSGCSSTARDAATITYNDADGEHTAHISESDFQDQLRVLGTNEDVVSTLTNGAASAVGPDSATVDAAFASAWLNELINFQAARIEADRLGITPTDDDRAAARTKYPGLTGSGLDGAALMAAVQGATAEDATPEDAQAFFDQHKAALTQCDGGAIFALQFADPDEAQDVREQISAMKGDIDEVWQSAGAFFACINQMPAELRGDVRDQPLGTAIGPVAFEGSYFLFTRTDHEPGFELYEQTLVQALGDPASMINVQRYVMDVYVNARYGEWDEAEGFVLAPVVPQPNSTREGGTDDVLVSGDLATG
jgi:hypothetical protein